MTLDEAVEILSLAARSELQDHAFGDREISWVVDGVQVADGYSGSTGTYVDFYGEGEGEDGFPTTIGEFEGRDASKLLECGFTGPVERNDSTGPDRYADGVCMPSLTLEGVRDELTK
jgi:hypothetical protein